MQETLYRIGDKPVEFVGSHEWIGSCEIFLLIDTICDIPCKIEKLADGAQVTELLGSKLVTHFQTQGSPVMVGGTTGGALTILGVDYDKHNANCRFLLLDPHYQGEDNVEMICRRPWCYWTEDANVFGGGAWYNFCFPQVTHCSQRSTSSSWKDDEVVELQWEQ